LPNCKLHEFCRTSMIYQKPGKMAHVWFVSEETKLTNYKCSHDPSLTNKDKQGRLRWAIPDWASIQIYLARMYSLKLHNNYKYYASGSIFIKLLRQISNLSENLKRIFPIYFLLYNVFHKNEMFHWSSVGKNREICIWNFHLP